MKKQMQDNSIYEFVNIGRNAGLCDAAARVYADIADMVKYRNVTGFEQLVAMRRHSRGLRILLTNDVILMETEWFDGVVGWKGEWQDGVYVYDCGEAYLFPVDINGDTFRFIRTLDAVPRPTPEMKKTYAEAKSKALTRWRLVYQPSWASRFALVSETSDQFNLRHPLREALLDIKSIIDKLIPVIHDTLRSPIPVDILPCESVYGYIPAFLCHLLRSYIHVCEWGLEENHRKQAREVLISLESQIRDELFKLKKAVSQDNKVDSNNDPRLIETIIRCMVEIKRERRISEEIEVPRSIMLDQALNLVEQHCETIISGLGGCDLVRDYFNTQGVNDRGFILSREVTTNERTPTGVIPLKKLLEPGFHLPHERSPTDTNSPTLVVRIDGFNQFTDKFIRQLRYVVVKWMHDLGKAPDLVIICN